MAWQQGFFFENLLRLFYTIGAYSFVLENLIKFTTTIDVITKPPPVWIPIASGSAVLEWGYYHRFKKTTQTTNATPPQPHPLPLLALPQRGGEGQQEREGWEGRGGEFTLQTHFISEDLLQ